MNIEDDESNSDDDIRTPIRPSAKALGKRRVVESPDGTEFTFQRVASTNVLRTTDGESNVGFFGRNDPYRDSAVDSDSDDVGLLPGRQPTRYVYDAAAERTAQHLRDKRLVNGVH